MERLPIAACLLGYATLQARFKGKAFKLNYTTPTNNKQRISSNPRNRQIAQPSMNMGQDRHIQMVGGNGENQFRQGVIAKAFKLNYTTPTNNNQRISSNPRNRQIAQPSMNMGQDRQIQMVGGNGENQFRQYAGQNVGNLNGYNDVQNNVGNSNGLIGVPGNANQNGNGNLVAARAEGNATQASTSGTQTDKALVYESYGSAKVIQICLWCVDSGCSKHMTGNLKLLINFVWKFMGIVRFGNDHVAAILGFDDLQWGNILITMVYFVRGLGYNLFSVGQFCDSDLEEIVQQTFTPSISMIWPLHLQFSSWLVLLSLSHPKFKYHKEHLCPSYEQGKSKRASHPPKPVPNYRQRLLLLHIDLCGPMRIAIINGKRALCYPKNDHEDIGKLGAKGDIGFFIGYSADSCAYRVYNRRTKKIMETMNVSFDELSAMAFEQRSLKPRLQTMYNDYIGGQLSAAQRTVPASQAQQVCQASTTSTSIADSAPTPTNSSSQATNFPNNSQDVDELRTQQQHAQQQGNQVHL
nr:integrase, catalytic region, zinc finger, CCHC-type, peptidase aspartic, catalytic [Tanacetum cinerariifolium]